MCGIVGILGKTPVAMQVVDALKRLEYRGYDSAGVATLEHGHLQRRRAEGKLRNLEIKLSQAPLSGAIGIGHTRWATHGRPSEENAHPHTDCDGSLVVVHNGIIENYLEIKEHLLSDGHRFKSETDTEVIAHLIEHHLRGTRRLDRAVKAALKEVRGSYALGVVCTVLALALGGYGIGYWIDNSNFPGPLFGGVAVLFVLGIQGFILALVGEYLGRIQREVEGRPLYTIDKEL